MAESELVRRQLESLGGLKYATFPLLYGDVSIFRSAGRRMGPTPTLRPIQIKKFNTILHLIIRKITSRFAIHVIRLIIIGF